MARGIEQAAIVPVQDGESVIALEAIWLAPPRAAREADADEPAPVAVVAAPHPSYGGSLDNPVVTELAHALRGCGAGTLRFNWRGVGASQGDISPDVEQAATDFTAALDHVDEGQPLIGAGYSFGAATAMRVALRDPRVRALVLVAAPIRMLQALPIDELRVPVLFIAGTRDTFAPRAEIDALLRDLPGARVEWLGGIDHFFGIGLGELAAALREQLPGHVVRGG
jgi:uncharacterized protein